MDINSNYSGAWFFKNDLLWSTHYGLYYWSPKALCSQKGQDFVVIVSISVTLKKTKKPNNQNPVSIQQKTHSANIGHSTVHLPWKLQICQWHKINQKKMKCLSERGNKKKCLGFFFSASSLMFCGPLTFPALLKTSWLIVTPISGRCW